MKIKIWVQVLVLALHFVSTLSFGMGSSRTSVSPLFLKHMGGSCNALKNSDLRQSLDSINSMRDILDSVAKEQDINCKNTIDDIRQSFCLNSMSSFGMMPMTNKIPQGGCQWGTIEDAARVLRSEQDVIDIQRNISELNQSLKEEKAKRTEDQDQTFIMSAQTMLADLRIQAVNRDVEKDRTRLQAKHAIYQSIANISSNLSKAMDSCGQKSASLLGVLIPSLFNVVSNLNMSTMGGEVAAITNTIGIVVSYMMQKIEHADEREAIDKIDESLAPLAIDCSMENVIDRYCSTSIKLTIARHELSTEGLSCSVDTNLDGFEILQSGTQNLIEILRENSTHGNTSHLLKVSEQIDQLNSYVQHVQKLSEVELERIEKLPKNKKNALELAQLTGSINELDQIAGRTQSIASAFDRLTQETSSENRSDRTAALQNFQTAISQNDYIKSNEKQPGADLQHDLFKVLNFQKFLLASQINQENNLESNLVKDRKLEFLQNKSIELVIADIEKSTPDEILKSLKNAEGINRGAIKILGKYLVKPLRASLKRLNSNIKDSHKAEETNPEISDRNSKSDLCKKSLSLDSIPSDIRSICKKEIVFGNIPFDSIAGNEWADRVCVGAKYRKIDSLKITPVKKQAPQPRQQPRQIQNTSQQEQAQEQEQDQYQQ